MIVDVLRWWLVTQALGLAALPLTFWFFNRLPDRGYSLAKPFGLLLTGYGAWLLSMLGLGALDRWLLIAVALGWAILGVTVARRAGLRAFGDALHLRRRWIVSQEILFALAIYTGLWLRWHQFWNNGAAINITEQPMDLTLLNGILASTQFPPQDPWLAGYPINYYYLGYLLVAVLTRLSGVTAGVGYTLGLATIFAFTACGVAGLVRNLVDATDHGPPTTDHGLRTTDDGPWTVTHESLGVHRPASVVYRSSSIVQRPWSIVQRPSPIVRGLSSSVRRPSSSVRRRSTHYLTSLVPLLGVLFVLIAGNQAGALQVLTGSVKAVALTPSQLWVALWNGIGPRASLELPPSFPAHHFGGESQLTPGDVTQDFSFAWWPSRVVWDDLPRPDGSVAREYTITEFPFFSFLLGDLHPHVLALPWTLLAIAAALNVTLRSSAPEFRGRGGWLRLLLTGIIVGGLYAINSWDLPTYLLLYLGALTLLYARLADGPRRVFWAHWAQQAGMTALASYVVYLPFHLSFVAPTQGFPLGLSPARTDLHEFIIIFGLFFVPLLAWVIHAASHARSALDNVWLLFVAAGLALFGILIGWPLIGLMPLATWAVAVALERRDQPATAFALWMFAVGALVIWGVDLLYLRDNYGSQRLNTIFKFYYQVWLIWGTLAAYAVWSLLRRPRPVAALWIAPFVVLLIGALVYPAVAPADDPPPRVIDGLAYLDQAAPDEAAAIRWIMDNTAPDAIVLQAPGIAYRADTARFATATGRPTLVGWTQHERLWRGGQPEVGAAVTQREQDTITIYTTGDTQLVQSLLSHYGVRYVVVGPQEQRLIVEHHAPPESLAKFDAIMPRVFEQGSVVIYQTP